MEIDSDKNEENAVVTTGDDSIDVVRKRVIGLPEIRRHVFGFLTLEWIKTCRLVCQEWNSTAKELLMARSRIRFHNNRNDPEEARLPDKFIDEFKTGSLLKKCDKFCFNSPDSSIEYEDMSSFIEQFGSEMKELTIFRTDLRNVLYDLSSKDLIKLIPSNLTKLDVVTEYVRTQLMISMKRLKNIKTLRLGGCILKINDSAVCAPVELKLKNVFFLRNAMNYLGCVTLNNLFDLRNLKVLYLHCSDVTIKLDLSGGALNLKELVLNRVELINWETSTWNVKKLTLCKKMKVPASSGMEFEELAFSGLTLDMAFLPTNLKSLAIERLKTKLLHIEVAQSLVNLKHLVLHRKDFSLLKHFHACANLTHLHLIPVDENDGMLATIDVTLIPKTVKVLRLSYDCELEGKTDFEIEKVIIEYVPFADAYDHLTVNLVVKNAFLYCSNFDFDIEGDGIDEVLQVLMLQSFIVGPFLLSRSDQFSFLFFDENPSVECLMKTSKDGNIIVKEAKKTEIDRLKNSWWTNDEISF